MPEQAPASKPRVVKLPRAFLIGFYTAAVVIMVLLAGSSGLALYRQLNPASTPYVVCVQLDKLPTKAGTQ